MGGDSKAACVTTGEMLRPGLVERSRSGDRKVRGWEGPSMGTLCMSSIMAGVGSERRAASGANSSRNE